MQGIMEFEWQQYDSVNTPPEYYGVPTEERRAKWELLYNGQFSVLSRDIC